MDDKPPSAPVARRQITIRIAAFSTTAMIAEAITSALRRKSLEPALTIAEFGNVIGDLIAPQSIPDVMIVVLDQHSILSRDWRLSADDAQTKFVAWLDMLLAAIAQFAEGRPASYLVVNTVPHATAPLVGHLDAIHPDGLSYRIAELNRRLRELAARHGNVRLIESDPALANIAPSKRSDPKLWFYGRIPYTAAADTALAEAFAAAIDGYSRPKPKVLALDLDDTLWRGIYGEAGAHGVECGDDFPGNAFKAFQHECLRLKSQGMLLTILSKNDPDAFDVFDKNPNMLLRKSDFVAARINWSPKAENVRELATELNLGLDTFLFIDDSPHEREAMRQLAAPVCVLDLPADPALRVGALRSYSQLWPLRLTAEDVSRTELYSARLNAEKAKASVPGLANYLASLDQRLVVKTVAESGVARIAQMHGKTNQFNLTTRRYSESDLLSMLRQREHLVLQGSVSDRFGEHGIVICAVASISGCQARIASFLMSCRVIAREIEFAFLGSLIDQLKQRGVTSITGEFIPTERNGPAANFLNMAGFAPVADSRHPGQQYVWRTGVVAAPSSRVVKIEN